MLVGGFGVVCIVAGRNCTATDLVERFKTLNIVHEGESKSGDGFVKM
jgi:hypothetical protein